MKVWSVMLLNLISFIWIVCFALLLCGCAFFPMFFRLLFSEDVSSFCFSCHELKDVILLDL